MLSSYLKPLLKPFFLVLTLIGVYLLLRLGFLWANWEKFKFLNSSELFLAFTHGLLFDLSVICYINALWLLLCVWINNRKALTVVLWLFIISNGFFFLLNISDCFYYEFSGKRSGIEFFQLLGISNDIVRILPQFLKDYYYAFILGFILLTLWFLLSKMVFLKNKETKLTSKITSTLLLFTFLFLGARGGWSLKPLRNIDAASAVGSRGSSLVLNTSFTVLQSLSKPALPDYNFYPQTKWSKYGSYIEGQGGKPNIVILILESFGAEHCGFLHSSTQNSITPFLDSLSKHSIVYTNGFANAKKSIEGIPAIISGIPAWMEQPFISSIYSANQFNSLPELLLPLGYSTHFYHGGANGTMGFDLYCKSAGIKEYYGKNEYKGKSEDDDGNWGIWDEQFLQFAAMKLNSTKEPFCSSIFTLSSHHPFKLPSKYQERFKVDGLPIRSTIKYTDYALKEFFNTIKASPWFKNTIFVITADHTSISEDNYYNSPEGQFRVPVLLYSPSLIEARVDSNIINQIDIAPTLLELTQFKGFWKGFGKSCYKSSLNMALSYKEGYFYAFKGDSSAIEFNAGSNQFKALNCGKIEKTSIPIDTKVKERTMDLVSQYYWRMKHNHLTND